MAKISIEIFQGIGAFFESGNIILILVATAATISLGIIGYNKFRH